MKKLTQNFQASLFGRISIILISFLIPHTLLFLFYKFVLPLDRTLYSKDQLKAIAWVWVSLWITLPFLTYLIAKWRRWDIAITKRVMIAFQRKKERLEQKLLGFQHKLRESRLSIQKSYYKPVSMVFTNTPDAPFDFILKLSAPLVRDQQQKPLLPIVTINGIQVAVKECENDLSCVVLFTRKAITYEKKFLEIRIGGEVLMEPNPFWVDVSCKDRILWQCQGHGAERKTILSPNYFPQAKQGLFIPCSMKVHKDDYGPYFGLLDELGNDIIIQLNKDFGEKDTLNKKVFLYFNIGISRYSIWMPAPSVLVRDGQLVA
jgi:hypothetical protein